MNFDKKDAALLNALQANSSQRLEDLAKSVGLAPSSVHDRLRRLQREGVIKKWAIEVDYAKLGLDVLAFIAVRGRASCSEIQESIAAIPEVEESHSVAGEYCSLLKVRVSSPEQLLETTEKLRKIPGIEGTNTTIVLKTSIDRPSQIAAPESERRASA